LSKYPLLHEVATGAELQVI